MGNLGFDVYATESTYDFLKQSKRIYQGDEVSQEEVVTKQCNGLALKTDDEQSALAAQSNEAAAGPNWYKGRLIKAHKALQKPDASELIENGVIGVVINVSGSLQTRSDQSAGYNIRRAAINAGGNK